MRKSIFILDDDMDIAEVIKLALQRKGLSVFSFTDPVYALDHLLENYKKYSLILIDLRMPGLNGIEFANMIRIVDQKIKIILMTAFTIEKIKNMPEFTTANFTNVIEKPLPISDLIRIIMKNCSETNA